MSLSPQRRTKMRQHASHIEKNDMLLFLPTTTKKKQYWYGISSSSREVWVFTVHSQAAQWDAIINKTSFLLLYDAISLLLMCSFKKKTQSTYSKEYTATRVVSLMNVTVRQDFFESSRWMFTRFSLLVSEPYYRAPQSIRYIHAIPNIFWYTTLADSKRANVFKL